MTILPILKTTNLPPAPWNGQKALFLSVLLTPALADLRVGFDSAGGFSGAFRWNGRLDQ